jgi:hypothetical protein
LAGPCATPHNQNGNCGNKQHLPSTSGTVAEGQGAMLLGEMHDVGSDSDAARHESGARNDSINAHHGPADESRLIALPGMQSDARVLGYDRLKGRRVCV